MDASSSHPTREPDDGLKQVVEQFRNEFRGGRRPSIEAYLAKHPKQSPELLERLVVAEVELIREAGETPDKRSYLRRFPTLRNSIESLVESEDTVIGSTVARPSMSSVKTTEAVVQAPDSLGRYRVLRELGRGGFGVVYLAHDPQLDRSVAIKVPRSDRFASHEQVANFISEARVAARLKHPLVIAVYDVQESDGLPFIVQEYIDGPNLHDWARDEQPTFQRIAEVMVGVAEGVGYAHQQRLTHCDLKLANVQMDQQGRPHVADFGLAVHEGKRGKHKGARFGTPSMMAPEQVRGEGHRLDDRTDIWAMGVMLYELLVSRRPFTSRDPEELFDEILHLDPVTPRQLDRTVPKELERICLKCMSKLRKERYNTADDLREDLLLWLGSTDSTRSLRSSISQSPTSREEVVPDSSSAETEQVVPRGLRSFDAADADFFLQLLPGPRSRSGLPDTIEFWKQRIEQQDGDETFAVGLIYGPSGSGKSSFVKAGLLPRLSDYVHTIYVEATPHDTEQRILQQLAKHVPGIEQATTLPDAFANLRQQGLGRRRKLLLVIDQFEQWLHAHTDYQREPLVDALKQCEGGRLQVITMVREDFYLAVYRLFQSLEVPLVEGKNFSVVDLFSPEHARKVLRKFGEAYGAIGETVTPQNEAFLSQAVDGLQQGGRVICVQLALFADMMSSRPWTPESLRSVGGVGGVGCNFLEETFYSRHSSPSHRIHAKASQGVLEALLPGAGTDIRGGMRSESILRAASGYETSEQFDDLVRVLNDEVRVITPTEPAGEGEAAGQGEKYFQLTHDYLVPAIRTWLAGKKQETRTGRAAIRLEERTQLWEARPEQRQLPSLLEWSSIWLLTQRRRWSSAQAAMMRNATRHHLVVLVCVLFAAITGIWGYQRYAASIANRELQTRVDSVQAAVGPAVPFAIGNLGELPDRMVIKELESRFQDTTNPNRLSIAFALAHYGNPKNEPLISAVETGSAGKEEVSNIARSLVSSKLDTGPLLEAAFDGAKARSDWGAQVRLATIALHIGEPSLAQSMLQAFPSTDMSKEVNEHRLDPLQRFRDDLSNLDELTEKQRQTSANRLKAAKAHYYLGDTERALTLLDTLIALPDKPLQVSIFHAICAAKHGGAWERDLEEMRSRDRHSASHLAMAEILALAYSGELQAAQEKLNAIVSSEEIDRLTQFNAACIAAQLAKIASPSDESLDVDMAQQAVAILRKGYLELDYRDRGAIGSNPDLAPLHGFGPFEELLAQISPSAPSWDPTPRTEFIEHFHKWSGDLGLLADQVSESTDPQLLSGLCLALGQIETISQDERARWDQVLADWHERTDAGIHSATLWLRRKWQLSSIPSKPRERAGSKQWWPVAESLTMVRVPAGQIVTEEKRIEIVEPFWIGDRELSQGLYLRFMTETHGMPIPEDWETLDRFDQFLSEQEQFIPADYVSWNDAVLFCNWLSVQLNREPYYQLEVLERAEDDDKAVTEVSIRGGSGFRLPTEDEWEYACRAMTTTDFFFGNSEARMRGYANYRSSDVLEGGRLMCNPWGLFDTHGNVWEWCWGGSGKERVNRGGSWDDVAWYCRSTNRYSVSRFGRNHRVGFRVVASDSRSSPAR